MNAEKLKKKKQTIWKEGGEKTVFPRGRVNWYGRDPEWKDTLGFRGRQDIDGRLGEWTHCEAVCKDDTLVYYVNGKLVNKAFGLNVTRGKLFFQTEGAECWYRNIELTPLG